MTPTTTQSPAGFAAAWAERAAARARETREGAWASERRRAAAGTLSTLKFPRRDEELWRRTDFASLEQALPSLDPFTGPGSGAYPSAARNVDELPPASSASPPSPATSRWWCSATAEACSSRRTPSS
jgi:hypothetical protein